MGALTTIYVPNATLYIKNERFNWLCKNNAINALINNTLVVSSYIQVLVYTKAWIWFKNLSGLSISGVLMDHVTDPRFLLPKLLGLI